MGPSVVRHWLLLGVALLLAVESTTKTPVVFQGSHGCIPGVSDLSLENFKEKSNGCLGNTGNLVWLHGAQSLIDATQADIFYLGNVDLDGRMPPADAVNILPTANAVFEAVKGHCAAMAASKFPPEKSIMIGLGSQATFLATHGCGRSFPVPGVMSPARDAGAMCTPESYNISDDFVDVLKRMRSRFKYVTVRGAFTRDVLHTHGIPSEALGCPSLMLSTDPRLGATLNEKVGRLADKGRNARFIITLPGGPYTKFRVARWSQFALGILQLYPGSCIVSQNPADVSVHQGMWGGVPGGVCTRIFGDLASWQAFSKDFDGAIGARIHGIMAPLSMGVPAFLIAPDHRVLELAIAMHIPHTSELDPGFNWSTSVLDLFAGSAHKWLEFDLRRQAVAKRYVEMLSDIGAPCSANLLRIASGPNNRQ